MRKAEIKAGVVVNIIEVDSGAVPDWCANWPTATDAAVIGATYFGGIFTAPVVPEPTLEEQKAARQAAYIAEADPLFFKWQAGEALEADWIAKRQEIRDRFPYAEVTP